MSIKLFVLVLAIASISIDALQAQSAASVSATVIEADSPDLYFGFFQLQLAISQASKADPAIARSAAHMMGISDTDFASVSAVAESVVAELQGLREQELAARRIADGANLSEITKSFEGRHVSALKSGIARLQSQLPRDRWLALRNYVNGPYRSSIHSRTLTVNAK